MRSLFLIAGLLAFAGQSAAGPWLRGEGEGFLSFSAEWAGDGGDIHTSVYYEYGVAERLTLGLDFGASERDIHKAVAFARWPLGPANGQIRMVFELGMGLSGDDAIIRPGFSIGRGFPLGATSGWMAIDTLAMIGSRSGDMDLSTDLTFGVNMSDRSKLIVQLQSGNDPMDPDYLKFAPSYVFERKPGQHIEVGVLAGIDNAEDFALKLGFWRKF